jgi:hypothetical protein
MTGGFEFRFITGDMDPSEASQQLDALYALIRDDNGGYKPVGWVDVERVEIGLRTGHSATRAEARASMKRRADERDRARDPSADPVDLYKALPTMALDPRITRQAAYGFRLIQRAFPAARDSMTERSKALGRLRDKAVQLKWVKIGPTINEIAHLMQKWHRL